MAPAQIGSLLRSAFAIHDASLPPVFRDLLARLEVRSSPASPHALSDAEFKKQLTALVPALRAFGRSLSRSDDMADDLAQDTLVRAWAARDRFIAGTNLKSWCFTILRNGYLSQMRRKRFTAEWDERVAYTKLVTPADQDRRIHLNDVEEALLRIAPQQREVLILVGTDDMTYEEASVAMDVPIGTIKSRVARGRQALVAELSAEEDETTV